MPNVQNIPNPETCKTPQVLHVSPRLPDFVGGGTARARGGSPEDFRINLNDNDFRIVLKDHALESDGHVRSLELTQTEGFHILLEHFSGLAWEHTKTRQNPWGSVHFWSTFHALRRARDPKFTVF